MNHEAVIAPLKGALHVVDYHYVVALGVLPSEDSQSAGIEVSRGPLAFYGQGRSAPRSPYEVDLMLLLITPIADRPASVLFATPFSKSITK